MKLKEMTNKKDSKLKEFLKVVGISILIGFFTCWGFLVYKMAKENKNYSFGEIAGRLLISMGLAFVIGFVFGILQIMLFSEDFRRLKKEVGEYYKNREKTRKVIKDLENKSK